MAFFIIKDAFKERVDLLNLYRIAMELININQRRRNRLVH